MSQSSNYFIIGTAGHIDHGKTEFVKSLTGIDTDRLSEEKKRGMSIELGFAYVDFDDNRIGIIDVPGHKKFIRKMVSGAAGIDYVILVIDIREGIKPQTIEHLDVVNLLGIKKGIVIGNKIDLVDPEELDLIKQLFIDDVEKLTQNTFLKDAPVFFVSSKEKTGFAEVKEQIQNDLSTITKEDSVGIVRLPIDRVFSLKGIGTTITGTLFSGTISAGDKLVVLPENVETKARSIQVHNDEKSQASFGQRTAINLQDISLEEIERGSTITTKNAVSLTKNTVVKLTILPNISTKLKNGSLVHLNVGSGFTPAKIFPLFDEQLSDNKTLYCKISMKKEIVTLRNDRFIILSADRERTIGGGKVLDPHPEKKRKNIKKDFIELLDKNNLIEIIVYYLEKMKMFCRIDELTKRFSVSNKIISSALEKTKDELLYIALKNDEVLVSKKRLEHLLEIMEKAISNYFAEFPSAIDLQIGKLEQILSIKISQDFLNYLLEILSKKGVIEKQQGFIKYTKHKVSLSEEEKRLQDNIINYFQSESFSPPLPKDIHNSVKSNPKEIDRMINIMNKSNILVKLNNNLIYCSSDLDKIQEKILKHFTKSDQLEMADAKAILNLSRKYLIPLLEHFDKIGLTERKDNYRILKQK